jgi:hypothetical protein
VELAVMRGVSARDYFFPKGSRSLFSGFALYKLEGETSHVAELSKYLKAANGAAS